MIINNSYFASFPSEDISIKDKREKADYSMQMAQAIYGYALTDKSSIFNQSERYYINKLFGEGRNDTDFYRDILDPLEPVYTKGTDGKMRSTGVFKRAGLGNIRYENIPILATIKDVFIGKLTQHEEDIECVAFDEFADDDRKQKKEELWFKSQNKDLYDNVMSRAGLKTEQLEYQPESRQELEDYFKVGGIRLDYEEAIEAAIANDITRSNWREVRRRVYEDIFNNNVMIVGTYVDKDNMQVRYERKDPMDSGMQYSKYYDHRDSTFFYEYKEITIAELRKRTGWDEDVVKEVATTYNGMEGINSTKVNPNDKRSYGAYYDDLYVPIFITTWLGIDTEREFAEVEINKDKVKETELQSGKIYEKDGAYYKQVPTDKIHEVSINTYQATWVIGTDYVYDWGLMHDQVKRTGMNSELPFVMITFPDKSINERCQPYVNDIHIDHYKYQNANATAPNIGYGYSFDVLESTRQALGLGSIADVLSIRSKGSGNMVLKLDTSTNYEKLFGMNQNGGIPLIKLEGGLGSQLNEFISKFAWNMQKIQQAAGLTPADMQVKQAADTSATELELATKTSDNMLRISADLYTELKNSIVQKGAYRVQKLITYNKISEKTYAQAIGRQSVEALQKIEKSNLSPTTWGINIVSRPTDTQKKSIIDWLNKLAQSGQEGQPGTLPNIYFAIIRMLDAPNGLKKAEKLLVVTQANIQKDAQKQRMASMQQQMQLAQSTNKQKLDNEIALEKTKKENKIEELKAEGDEKIRVMMVNHVLELHKGDVNFKMDTLKDIMGNMMSNPDGIDKKPDIQLKV